MLFLLIIYLYFVGCWIFKGDTWGTGRSQYGYRIDNIIQATRTKSSHLYWAQQFSMEFSFSIHSPFNFLQYCIIQCHCHYLWQQYYFTIAVGEWHLHFQCRAVVEFSMKAWNIQLYPCLLYCTEFLKMLKKDLCITQRNSSKQKKRNDSPCSHFPCTPWDECNTPTNKLYYGQCVEGE